eukprot:2353817-Amphidinium_carterae.2
MMGSLRFQHCSSGGLGRVTFQRRLASRLLSPRKSPYSAKIALQRVQRPAPPSPRKRVSDRQLWSASGKSLI